MELKFCMGVEEEGMGVVEEFVLQVVVGLLRAQKAQDYTSCNGIILLFTAIFNSSR